MFKIEGFIMKKFYVLCVLILIISFAGVSFKKIHLWTTNNAETALSLLPLRLTGAKREQLFQVLKTNAGARCLQIVKRNSDILIIIPEKWL